MDNCNSKFPLVSIIIPCFNSESTIVECVASSLEQDYFNIEVIVVDDGSKDDTYKIMQETYSNDTRVKIIRQPNKGVSSARFRGLCEAKGSYVKYLDSDDILAPASISAALSTALKYCLNSSTVVVGKAYEFVDDISVAFPSTSYGLAEFPVNGDKINPWFIVCQALTLSLCLFPTSSLRLSGAFDRSSQLGEEYILHSVLLLGGISYVFIDKYVVFIRNSCDPMRLSRRAAQEDYAYQFLQISKMLTAMSSIFGSPPKVIAHKISVKLWSLGRQCCQREMNQLARCHFSLSKRVKSGAFLHFNSFYSITCIVLGPIIAERFFQLLKRIFHCWLAD